MKPYLIALFCLAGTLRAYPVIPLSHVGAATVRFEESIFNPIYSDSEWQVHPAKNVFDAAVFLDTLEKWQSAYSKIIVYKDTVWVYYPKRKDKP